MGSVIAIDGPSASGKSTVAKRVASALGYAYVDSGALYRGVTWKALGAGVDTADAEAVSRLADEFPLEFFLEAGSVRFRIAGVEPGQALRTESLNAHVSRVAAIPEVRACVGKWLRSMEQFGDLVVEGRDIGTAVFPGAVCKFYLDASEEERARRRHEEVQRMNERASKKEIGDSLLKRDAMDRTRRKDPLRVAADAVVIDSTVLTIEQVVGRILDCVKNRTSVQPGGHKKGAS